MERRKHPRRKLAHTVVLQVTFVDSKAVPQKMDVRLLDEAEQGLAISAPVHLASGTILTLRADATAGAFARLAGCKARVQWCLMDHDGTFQAGLFFVDPPPVDNPGVGRQAGNAVEEPSVDHYETLQLSPKADPDTVHRVFRLLAQRYHPDNAETGNAETFRRLIAAYQVLSDPEKRAAYDVRRVTTREQRWKIFDTAQAAHGMEAEKRKRQGILSLLYTKRVREPQQPALSLREMEDLLGCPREHLEFSLWYLKEGGLIGRADNACYTITMQGVNAAEAAGEASKSLPEDRLLPA
jgi:hypothetical protein